MSHPLARLIPKPLAACFARCLRMLDALGQAGRERMAALRSGGADVDRSAKAFGGLVRAMGLIMLLESRLRTLIEAAASGAIAAPAAAGPSQVSVASAARVPADEKDGEPDSVSERAESPYRPDPRERPERLERERFPWERGTASDPRSLSELVAAACRDLGLDADAAREVLAPFLELEALLAGKPPLDPPMDRARPRAPFLGTAEPPDAKRARVDARGPETAPRADPPRLSKRARRRLRGRPP